VRPRLAAQLAACAGVLLALACATVDGEVLPPEVNVIDIRPLERTAFEQRMQVDLRVQNPNDFALDIDGVRFDLDLNGEPFARGLGDERVSVPRLGEARISVTSTTTMVDWMRQFAVLAGPGRKDMDYRVSGRLFLRGASAPHVDFESSGNLTDAAGLGGR